MPISQMQKQRPRRFITFQHLLLNKHSLSATLPQAGTLQYVAIFQSIKLKNHIPPSQGFESHKGLEATGLDSTGTEHVYQWGKVYWTALSQAPRVLGHRNEQIPTVGEFTIQWGEKNSIQINICQLTY